MVRQTRRAVERSRANRPSRPDPPAAALALLARLHVPRSVTRKEYAMVKVVDSIQYHVWSDALHARQLARETKSPWDRGAYVRWAIQTAWSAFENVCVDTLEAENLGMRFREHFDKVLEVKGLSPVDWGQGIWQQVLQVYRVRKEFVHVVPSISHARLMTPLEDAERAISVLRDGIRAVSDLVASSSLGQRRRGSWMARATARIERQRRHVFGSCGCSRR
jgi:hypothetical protein